MKQITLKSVVPFLILLIIAGVCAFIPTLPNFDDGKYNGADIAWMLVATALVFIMTPGLAFFYGGMVHKEKNFFSKIKKIIKARRVKRVLLICGWYSKRFMDSSRV